MGLMGLMGLMGRAGKGGLLVAAPLLRTAVSHPSYPSYEILRSGFNRTYQAGYFQQIVQFEFR